MVANVIAVDTNILVYAHREDSPFHEVADHKLTKLAESLTPWAIPWSCLFEFLAIVTHPKIYKPPTPLEDALQQIDCWLESPTLELLGEGENFWLTLRQSLTFAKIRGPMVHDVRIANVCLYHGVDVFWTADRDYSRMPALKCKNPLVMS